MVKHPLSWSLQQNSMVKLLKRLETLTQKPLRKMPETQKPKMRPLRKI